MKNLNLRSLVVGPVMTNCYFLQNKETTELILVDPGAEAERISKMIEKLGKKPVAILLTHGHYDHMMAVNELRQEWKIPIFFFYLEILGVDINEQKEIINRRAKFFIK